MLQHVINRTGASAGIGAVAIATAGAVEGIITGAIFHLCLQTSQLGRLRWLLGRGFNAMLEAAQLGGFIGFFLGRAFFTYSALIFPTRSLEVLLKTSLKFGILGTVIGVLVGAVSGAITGIAVT
jgi:hypothetical protein